MLLCPCVCVCPGPTGSRSCQPGTAGTASSCPTARGTSARRLARRRGPRRAEGSRSGRVPRCSFPACGNRPRTPCAAGAVLPQQVRPQAPPVVAAAAPLASTLPLTAAVSQLRSSSRAPDPTRSRYLLPLPPQCLGPRSCQAPAPAAASLWPADAGRAWPSCRAAAAWSSPAGELRAWAPQRAAARRRGQAGAGR